MVSVFLCLLVNCEQHSKEPYSQEQQYLFSMFENRRSVRGYKSDPIPDEQIEKIIDIARTAPTSGNQQPWKFLVIKDREKIDALNNATADAYIDYYKANRGLIDEEVPEKRQQLIKSRIKYLEAPVFIVVLTDNESKYPNYNKWDGPMAASHLMVAARALGYGTVFLTDSFPLEIVRDVFQIPERYEIVCTTPLGIPKKWPDKPDKKNLDDFISLETITE